MDQSKTTNSESVNKSSEPTTTKSESTSSKIVIEGMAAKDLNELVHVLTARNLIRALESDEFGMSPGVLQCALRFLADNGITGTDLPANLQEEIKKRYAEKAPFKIAK